MAESGQVSTQEQDFGTFADGLNQALITAGTTFAEQAFGLGCSLSIIPIGLVLLVAVILGARNWITISLVGLAELLVALVIVSSLSIRARRRAIARVYQNESIPAIRRYIDEQGYSLDEFIGKVAERLPESALLLQNLKNGQFNLDPELENNPEKE
jgi:hypothetical protein